MEYGDKITDIREKNAVRDQHYYGDTVRSIYMGMALIMLVTTPFFSERIIFSAMISIFAVLLLSIFAGFTNPKSRFVIVLDFLISTGVFLVFGYEATVSYGKSVADLFFLTNLALAVLSLFALYFSSKTLRGKIQA